MCSSPEPYYEALPSSFKPIHYDVSIFDISKTAYNGKVFVELEVVKPSDRIHLHFRDLVIGAVSASELETGLNLEAAIAEENKKKEYFAIQLATTLGQVGTRVSLQIEFSGRIQTNMAGFYSSSYEENGQTKNMLSTQFEATDARRAFPCLDEPALKATFSVHLTTETHLTVLGNTPVAEVREVVPGLKTTTFERTPVMSTYLLAWAVGEFEYIEAFTEDLYVDNKPLPVRIYTTKGYSNEAKLALELAPKIVDLFSKVFKVKYPLPKLDLIAVHAFSHNAMENWGLITYRSTSLLFSNETSDLSYKQKVVYVIAHEIAHQWFGNLVTMQWWDELWLNEGFATWVGYYAVDHLFPEWDIFSMFTTESLQEALKLDGLRNSHPIKVEVVDALDIDQLFDAISYLKGASTIHMLSNYLTADVFLDGVSKYLDANKYGNATSEDLWNAVSEASGRDVSRMMSPWISEIGFPVVEVTRNGESLALQQSQFLSGGDVKPGEDETRWWIPLDTSCSAKSFSVDSFDEKSIKLQYVVDGPFKLNKDTGSPFRVNYETALFHENVLPYFSEFSVKDKVGIIADVASVAVSRNNFTSTVTFLDMVKHVAIDNDLLESNYIVWHELCSRLSTFANVFSDGKSEMSVRINNFGKSLYSRYAANFINEAVDNSDFSRSNLKALLLNSAADFKIPEIEEYSRALFTKWKAGEAIDPSLRSFVLSAVVMSEHVSKEDVSFITDLVINPPSLDSREIALEALGKISDVELAKNLMEFLIDESKIPGMDAHLFASSLSRNVKVRDWYWKFFKTHYTEIYALMSTNMVVLERLVRVTLCNYQSAGMEADVKEFFADKDVHGFERVLNQVLDQIHINASWYERDHEQVDQWLFNEKF